jgi:membrane-associated phospholipid phosphatase
LLFNKNKIARIVSTILVPPSFTIIIFTIFAFILESETLQRIITILVAFIFGFSALIILFVFFIKRGRIVDLDASVKEERTIPFLISVGFYTVGLILLIIFKVHIISIAFWFCYISNTLLTILVNKYWKISVHSMAAAGTLAAAAYAFGPIALIFTAVVFLVGWSRIQLKVHNFAQVITGILLAFLSTYIQMFFIVNWFK